VHLGYTGTDMTRGLNVIKNDPADVARAVLDGPGDGRSEVLADVVSARVQAARPGPSRDCPSPSSTARSSSPVHEPGFVPRQFPRHPGTRPITATQAQLGQQSARLVLRTGNDGLRARPLWHQPSYWRVA
jgi:hypothetical protein